MTLEIALFGLVLAAVMVFFCCKFLGYRLKMEFLLFVMAGPFLQYLGVLFLSPSFFCFPEYFPKSMEREQ